MSEGVGIDLLLLSWSDEEVSLLIQRVDCVTSYLFDSNWCPRQESNLYLPLRRGPFYPLNYEDEPGLRSVDCKCRAGGYLVRWRMASSSPLMVSGNMCWCTIS